MRLREGEADMDIRIVDVLVDRTSDTDAVLKAITSLNEFGGEYEADSGIAENVWEEEEKSFFPRAVYNFIGKYRYRICVWCIQDLTGQIEAGQNPEGENRMVSRFLETKEKRSHVIVRVGTQEETDCEKKDPDCIVFMGKIFL